MARSVRLRGYLRGKSADRRDGYQRSIVGNQRGELCIVEGLPASAEIVRLGCSWLAIGSAGVPALGSAFPSGSILMKLWNIGPDNGPSIVIDGVSVRVNANPTTPVATVMSINVALRAYPGVGSGSNTPPNPPEGQFTKVRSLRGKAQFGGVAAVAAAIPINGHLGISDWHFIGSIVSANTNILNLQKYVPLYGRYIVPPGGVFGLHGNFALPTEPGSSVFGHIWWHEVQIPNVAGMGRALY